MSDNLFGRLLIVSTDGSERVWIKFKNSFHKKLYTDGIGCKSIPVTLENIPLGHTEDLLGKEIKISLPIDGSIPKIRYQDLIRQ